MDLEIGTWVVPTSPIPVLPAEGASQSRGQEAGGDVNVAGTRGGGGGALPACLVCLGISCGGCLSATEYDTQWSDQPKRKSCHLCRKVFFLLFILSILFFIWPARVYVHGDGSDKRVGYRGCPATCDTAFGARERREENSVLVCLYLSVYVTQRLEHCADGLRPLVPGATARHAAAQHTSKNQDAPGSIRHGPPPAQRPLRV